MSELVLPDGRRTRYRVDGPAGAPGVLLLHGIGCSLEDFEDQHRLLAGEFRCTSVDLAGFGAADPLPGPVTLRALAQDVVGFLDAVGEPGPLHVVGNSLGGAVAMQTAVLAPRRVRSLLLADPAGFGRSVTWALRLVTVPGLGERLLRPSLAAARRNQRGVFADPAMVTQERVERAHRLSLRPHGPAVMTATARTLGTVAGVRSGWRRDLLPAVRALDVATLVVWGDQDRVLPPDHLDAVRAALPEARTHVFPGTGHMPQIERPVEFADLARRFWASL